MRNDAKAEFNWPDLPQLERTVSEILEDEGPETNECCLNEH